MSFLSPNDKPHRIVDWPSMGHMSIPEAAAGDL
jgi:hypothetical protein